MNDEEIRFEGTSDGVIVDTDRVEVHITRDSSDEEVKSEQKTESKKDTAAHIKDALKQVETFGQALSDALQARGNVVMVRVNDEALEHLDMLIEAEVTKSRSESAAFLINEGVKANQELFEKIGAITQQIATLRDQLRKQVNLGTPENES